VQHDLGDDTNSFDTALVHAIRHDPDVIVLENARSLHNSTALRAAETAPGDRQHYILPMPSALSTVSLIYPASQQHQISQQLAETLEAGLSQTLLNRISGGRIGPSKSSWLTTL